MYLSSKISHSVLTYLDDQGADLTTLISVLGSRFELMRDPSGWIAAPEMEFFLEKVAIHFKSTDGEILTKVGHKQAQLHSWGVLDSVLRMMTKTQEIFVQPQRFMSYFVSPEPPLENVIRNEDGIKFDWPLPSDQYPHITEYIRASFEALPTYMGQGLGQCQWNDITLELKWPIKTSELFKEDVGRQISPQLLQKVVEELQTSQRDLEEKNRELQKKNEELLLFNQSSQTLMSRAPSLPHFETLSTDPLVPGHKLGQNIARLHDYLVRAQQLITMILVDTKTSPSVKEAMRRMDWDYVKAHYPRTIAESVEILRQIQAPHKNSPAQNKDPEVKFNPPTQGA